MSAEKMKIVTEAAQYELKVLESPNKELKDLGFFKSAKVSQMALNVIWEKC